MQLWIILLLCLTFGFFLILGMTLSLKKSFIKSDNNQELVLVQVDSESWRNEPVKEYLTDSSLDEDEPLHKVAQSLSLKRNNSIKYKERNHTRNSTPKNVNDQYRPINVFSGKRFHTLPTPPSTPLWKTPISIVNSGSVSSIESMNTFENLEEKFSHSIQEMAMFRHVEPLDRATAVAFLKSKSQERLGDLGILRGKRLERIPTNEI